MSNHQAQHKFMSGLIDEIRAEVQIHNPRDLNHTTNLAQTYENKQARLSTYVTHLARGHAVHTPLCLPAPSAVASGKPVTTQGAHSRQVRHLSLMKMAEQCRQGLSFKFN